MNVQENLYLELPKIFGIHLFLSRLACFGFGAFHVAGLYGPGIWVSNPYGVTGKVQFVNPAWDVEGFDPFVSGGIASIIGVSPTHGIMCGHVTVNEVTRHMFTPLKICVYLSYETNVKDNICLKKSLKTELNVWPNIINICVPYPVTNAIKDRHQNHISSLSTIVLELCFSSLTWIQQNR